MEEADLEPSELDSEEKVASPPVPQGAALQVSDASHGALRPPGRGGSIAPAVPVCVS